MTDFTNPSGTLPALTRHLPLERGGQTKEAQAFPLGFLYCPLLCSKGGVQGWFTKNEIQNAFTFV